MSDLSVSPHQRGPMSGRERQRTGADFQRNALSRPGNGRGTTAEARGRHLMREGEAARFPGVGRERTWPLVGGAERTDGPAGLAPRDGARWPATASQQQVLERLEIARTAMAFAVSV